MNSGFCFAIESKETKALIEILARVVKHTIVCVFRVINHLSLGRIKD